MSQQEMGYDRSEYASGVYEGVSFSGLILFSSAAVIINIVFNRKL